MALRMLLVAVVTAAQLVTAGGPPLPECPNGGATAKTATHLPLAFVRCHGSLGGDGAADWYVMDAGLDATPGLGVNVCPDDAGHQEMTLRLYLEPLGDLSELNQVPVLVGEDADQEDCMDVDGGPLSQVGTFGHWFIEIVNREAPGGYELRTFPG